MFSVWQRLILFKLESFSSRSVTRFEFPPIDALWDRDWHLIKTLGGQWTLVRSCKSYTRKILAMHMFLMFWSTGLGVRAYISNVQLVYMQPHTFYSAGNALLFSGTFQTFLILSCNSMAAAYNCIQPQLSLLVLREIAYPSEGLQPSLFIR